MNERIPIEWRALEPGDPLDGGKEINHARQKEAPIIRDRREVESEWAELSRRNGRSCNSCRYFSPPDDMETQALMAKCHVVEAVEKECQIEGRYSLPLMQGICHLTTRVVGSGGFESAHLDFKRPSDFCESYAPKNRLLSFFGMGRTR